MITSPSPNRATPRRLPAVGGGWLVGPHKATHPLRPGCDVVTFDKLSTGHRDAVWEGDPACDSSPWTKPKSTSEDRWKSPETIITDNLGEYGEPMSAQALKKSPQRNLQTYQGNAEIGK